MSISLSDNKTPSGKDVVPFDIENEQAVLFPEKFDFQGTESEYLIIPEGILKHPNIALAIQNDGAIVSHGYVKGLAVIIGNQDEIQMGYHSGILDKLGVPWAAVGTYDDGKQMVLQYRESNEAHIINDGFIGDNALEFDEFTLNSLEDNLGENLEKDGIRINDLMVYFLQRKFGELSFLSKDFLEFEYDKAKADGLTVYETRFPVPIREGKKIIGYEGDKDSPSIHIISESKEIEISLTAEDIRHFWNDIQDGTEAMANIIRNKTGLDVQSDKIFHTSESRTRHPIDTPNLSASLALK